MSDTFIPHEFDRQVAQDHGINAALIYSYITWKCQRAYTGWAQLTLDEIVSRYSYLTKKQVRLVIERLTGKRGLVRREQAESGYAWLYQLKTKPVYTERHRFDAALAERYGVVAAVIHWSLSLLIKGNWRKLAEDLNRDLPPDDYEYDSGAMLKAAYISTRSAAKCKMTVAYWLERHPYIKQRTAEREFAVLTKAGLIQSSPGNDRVPVWYLRACELDKYLANRLSVGDLSDSTAKRAYSPPKGHTHRQKGILTAKKASLEALNDSGKESCDAVVIDSVVRDKVTEDTIQEDFNAIQPPRVLADARPRSAGTALTVGVSPSARKTDIKERLRKLSPVKLPRLAGEKRGYVRVPKMDDPEYYEYLDSLSVEERLTLLPLGS